MNHIKYIIVPSILFFIYNLAFFKGTHSGLAGKGAILVTTLNPLFTVLIMSIINKKIVTKEFLGILIGIVGGLVIMDVYNEGIDIILFTKLNRLVIIQTIKQCNIYSPRYFDLNFDKSSN